MLAYFLFVVALFHLALANAEIINEKVTRKIDLTSHLVKITHTINVNVEKGKYIFIIDPSYRDDLSYIAVTNMKGNEESEIPLKADSKMEFPIQFQSKLFTVITIFTHKLSPFPAEILQSERQYIKFNANVYYYSKYKTIEQETTLLLPTPVNLLSHSQSPAPVKKSENKLIYGPYKNIEPLFQQQVDAHYENNSPFITVTKISRLIEISHWGNIAVEETIDLFHTGAKLKNAFSRFEYQRNQGGMSAVRNIKTMLPAAAKDVYYRDEIGNISTSHLRELMDAVEVELQPRFPLFGGWKTRYTLGYNVPAFEYLHRQDSHYGLRMRLLDHIIDDQVVDELTVRVVLPECVTAVRFLPPYDVVEGPNEIVKTYLDTSGRHVIVVHAYNLVEQHIRDFQLYYDFNQLLMVREPALIIGAFYILFMGIILWVRLDFSISRDEANEARIRINSLCTEVRATQDRRSALYQAYEDALNKFKASKDSAVLLTSRKKIDSDHQGLSQQMANLVTKIRQDSVPISEKVNELQNLDAEMRQQIGQSFTLADKLVGGKLSKAAYLEGEEKCLSSKQAMIAKIEAILTHI